MGERVRNEVIGDDYEVGRKPSETTRPLASNGLPVIDGKRVGELTLRNQIANPTELATVVDQDGSPAKVVPTGPEPPKPGTLHRTGRSLELEGEFIVTPRIKRPESK